MRPRPQPTLEALLSPLHGVTLLLPKPPESICCSEPWWFQDAGCPPRPEPRRVGGELHAMSDTACPALCKQVQGSDWQGTSLFCPGYLSVGITAWLPSCRGRCYMRFQSLRDDRNFSNFILFHSGHLEHIFKTLIFLMKRYILTKQYQKASSPKKAFLLIQDN